MNEQKFNKIVARLGRVIALVDSDIQTCAVWAIEQSIFHRNSTPANALFQAVSKCKGAMRIDSLARFFELYGHLGYLKADKKIVFFDVEETCGMPREFDEVKLMATPWRLAKEPESIESAWDVKDMLSKLVDKLEKATGKSGRVIGNIGMLADIKALVAKGNITPTPELIDEDAKVGEKLDALSLERLAA